MDYVKWIEAGKGFGLQGKELQDFVEEKERQYVEREERASEREHRKKMEEEELKIRKLEWEALKAKAESENTTMHGTISQKRPKLPNFDESKDDMDAYLERFERYARSQKWNEDTWAVSLSALLTGKGLQVYSSMPADNANDYQELKVALLKRYELTEEGFRLKFRDSKPLRGETVFQFVSRLSRFFKRWIELAGISKTFVALQDLVIREQFLATCSPDMTLFLRERVPKSVPDMTKLAEQFLEAHGGSIAHTRQTTRSTDISGNRPKPVPQEPHLVQRPGNRTTCYICNKEGHFARNCQDNSTQRRIPQPMPWRPPFSRGRQDFQPQRRFERPPIEFRRRQDGGIPQQEAASRSATSNTGALCQSVEGVDSPLAECIKDGQLKLANGQSVPVVSGICHKHPKVEPDNRLPVSDGYVGEHPVKVLRDTGCSSAAVKRELVDDEQLTGEEHWCVLIDGTIRRFAIAKIQVDSPFYTGEIEAMCMEDPVYDLVVGNIQGAKVSPDATWSPSLNVSAKKPEAQEKSPMLTVDSQAEQSSETKVESAAVTTRAQSEKLKKATKPLKVNQNAIEGMTTEQLKKAQAEDASLQDMWHLAESKEIKQTKGGNSFYVEVKNDILYRIYQEKSVEFGKTVRQIVVPFSYRDRVMSLAHESLMSGHLGTKKTLDRITTSFHWPGISRDVNMFCKSCDICQRTIPKGKVPKVPLGEMPIIEEPFYRIAIDLIGPLAPISDRGHRYILTIVDYATRYPEAIPLRKIDTVNVAEALLEVFSRVGFPNEILSDQGSQFTSDLMKEICRLVSVKQLFTTPYNPKCNGLTERINGVLKTMLKRMCQERPKDWDRYLPAILFAYREVPQASTGFSPFELLYGRTVRGPMQALKELWLGNEEPEVRNTYQYVLELRDKLEETCKIARENLYRAQGKFKHYYDKNAKKREFVVDDLVLVLLPTDYNKLTLQWRGPYKVNRVLNRMDYEVNVNNKLKVYHANLLKLYHERKKDESAVEETQKSPNPVKGATGIAVIEAEYYASEDNLYDELLEVEYSSSEGLEDVQISPEVSDTQRQQILALMKEYENIFTGEPGTTSLVNHKIELTTSQPIRQKPYAIPFSKKEVVKEEVEKMLKGNIIEPSNSAYNSPIVLVKKKDGTIRFCIDFRRLNAITKFDTEPMCNIEDILTKLHDDEYFSKFDLTKGYWQIPMEDLSKEMTAFTTEDGCYQFRKMPFGLVNSGATFNRMMRKLLDKARNLEHYIDDVLCHTKTWKDHLDALRELFTRIDRAGLTIKPSKCKIAYQQLNFLGHEIGKGTMSLEQEKVQKIKDAKPPENKKQVRAFLGLAGYYRKFIPNFATIATPLTNLTKKGQPNVVKWGRTEEQAFNTLKKLLTSSPILHLPDFSKPFIVQTDASEVGIGAVLMQEHNKNNFPIAFASRKLLPNEKNYSVIEKECLAIVYGIRQFQKYLYGTHFLLLTDHRPLTYIRKSKLESTRIMRWALFLQSYQFNVEPIKGSENVAADYLSRQTH